ncbi:oligoendopeptidase, pepF/M3 family [Candidatus Nitrososphaera gargensis Ga9.2]|uniref:Oligoendopeptidase, pepF/M3 family n=1 Tax=Nitrososphaera gargensis (strain Ga9.2) TaxID=1237085 RepID=K0ILH2_NITGG|nr:oligoendopeptidase, pepF/M3 family [Candidatus Nitrososphaera gargensis Ga9.2]
MTTTAYTTMKVGRWNLADLVEDPSSDQFGSFLRSIEEQLAQFERSRQILRQDISPVEFEGLLHLLESISEKISIASGYAHLRYYADTSSNEASALVIRMEKMASDIGNRTLFFDLWFKRQLDDENANRLINAVPQVYREYLRHKRLVAKYSLSEPEEKIINTLEVTGIGALVKIYDKMTSGFEFTVKLRRGRKIVEKKFDNKEKLVSLVRSPDANTREAAYKSLLEVYRKNSGVLGEIYQNVAVQWRDEAISMRGYKSPISVRNIANNLDDVTVEALLASCRKNSAVFQEYFREKAKMLGMKKLRRYDLYAPITTKASDTKKFTYGKAVQSVLDTFGDFDPQFRTLAERVFSERHVDSEIRKAKRGGAFCYTVTPKMTPYVLLNFDGLTRDVSTLAHEFGHAIHSMLASDLPIMVSHAPLPLAETASVFAEMLLNEKLAEKMSARERRLLLAEHIDDMYATIMRQAYFTLFEIEAHRVIAESNATIDAVAKIYFENLNEQFGSSIAITPDFQWEWVYIPHFYHTPFYTYAYSFGNLLVLSLYRQYKLEGKSSFVPKYFKILAAGGSRKPEELLMEAGIDISREEFWQQGFDYVREMIQQLKSLAP